MIDGASASARSTTQEDYSSIDHQLFSRLQYISVRRYRSWSGRTFKKKKAWILTYWQIVIDHYPKMNDKIQVSTWASKFKGMLAERNFCMTDENGEKAAYAQSVWVYMDVEKGRPVRPDQEELDAYGQCEPLEMDYESRKIALPEESMSLEPFPVRQIPY